MNTNEAFAKIRHHFRQGDMAWVLGNLIRKAWRSLGFGCHQLVRDAGNRIRYGKGAPRFCELIWVDANAIHRVVGNAPIEELTGQHRNWASGYVVEWNGVRGVTALDEELKIQRCVKHWRDGVSWDELGYIDMMKKAPRHANDDEAAIRQRFAMLDNAFEEARSTRSLKTRKQLDPREFRENGGILVHIAKHGEPVFGGNGFHRLAMARVLELSRIPACLGVVDKSAISLLSRFRR